MSNFIRSSVSRLPVVVGILCYLERNKTFMIWPCSGRIQEPRHLTSTHWMLFSHSCHSVITLQPYSVTCDCNTAGINVLLQHSAGFRLLTRCYCIIMFYSTCKLQSTGAHYFGDLQVKTGLNLWCVSFTSLWHLMLCRKQTSHKLLSEVLNVT